MRKLKSLAQAKVARETVRDWCNIVYHVLCFTVKEVIAMSSGEDTPSEDRETASG